MLTKQDKLLEMMMQIYKLRKTFINPETNLKIGQI